MTDDLLTSEEVRAILRVERTALARYLVGPDRIPHLRLGNPRTGPLRIRRSADEARRKAATAVDGVWKVQNGG